MSDLTATIDLPTQNGATSEPVAPIIPEPAAPLRGSDAAGSGPLYIATGASLIIHLLRLSGAVGYAPQRLTCDVPITDEAGELLPEFDLREAMLKAVHQAVARFEVLQRGE